MGKPLPYYLSAHGEKSKQYLILSTTACRPFWMWPARYIFRWLVGNIQCIIHMTTTTTTSEWRMLVTVRRHCMYAVHEMRPLATVIACSVCVCWSHGCTLQKWLNRLIKSACRSAKHWPLRKFVVTNCGAKRHHALCFCKRLQTKQTSVQKSIRSLFRLANSWFKLQTN